MVVIWKDSIRRKKKPKKKLKAGRFPNLQQKSSENYSITFNIILLVGKEREENKR